jgi:hypothetical protein
MRARQAPQSGRRRAFLGRDAVLRRALALADVVSVCSALLFVVLVVGSGKVHLRPATALLVPLVVVVSKMIGLYDRDQHMLRKTTIDEAPSILHLSVFLALTVWLAEALLLRGWFVRPEVFALVVGNFALILASRAEVVPRLVEL